MSKGDKILNALTLLGMFEKASVETPMVAMVNESTMMINGDGNAYLLVYSKKQKIEGFVQVEFRDDKLFLINKDLIIPKRTVKTFEDYRRMDSRIGMKMSAI